MQTPVGQDWVKHAEPAGDVPFQHVWQERERGVPTAEDGMSCAKPRPVESGAFLKGVSLARGIAKGLAFFLPRGADFGVAPRSIGQDAVSEEIDRVVAAISQADAQLSAMQASVAGKAEREVGDLLSAQKLILRDPLFLEHTAATIRKAKVDALSAVRSTKAALFRQFNAIDDPYFRERAADMRDAARRVLSILSEETGASAAAISPGAIVITDEILPSESVYFELQQVAGIVTEKGSPSSHAAVLARSLRLPAVAGIADLFRKIVTGDPVLIDGMSGLVFVHPGPKILREYERLRADLAAMDDARAALVDEPAQTTDGVSVEISANIGKGSDAEAAARFRADGVGLFRTEFAFAIRSQFPTEAEQVQVLTQVAERLRPHPVVVRVLDIGADKVLPYFTLPQARNPALAQRGIRLMLRHEEVLLPQLRAILRAAATHPIHALLPMVSGPEEVTSVRRLFELASAALTREGIPHVRTVPLGAMIEVPAAALGIRGILGSCDFVSVGTNDLVQHLLAADRDDPNMAEYYQAAHPAVLRMLHLIAVEARACGKPFSICGQIAADAQYTSLLLGLGYRRFSVAPGQIPEIKEAVRATSLREAEQLSNSAFEMLGQVEIAAALHKELAGRRRKLAGNLNSGPGDL